MKRFLGVLCLYFFAQILGAQGTYTVKPGDTFFSIAKNQGLSVDQLQDANPGVVASKIRVGLKLKIPQKSSGLETPVRTPVSAPQKTGTTGSIFSSSPRRLENPFPCAEFPPKAGALISPWDGRVVFRREYRGLGQVILLENSEKVIYGFGKIDKIDVNLGEEVRKGQTLGTTGGRAGVIFFAFKGKQILEPLPLLGKISP